MSDYVKLHTEVLNSRKIQTLPPSLAIPWINFLLLSRLNGGVLPDIVDIAFRLHTDQATVAAWLLALKKLRLIDQQGERGDYVMHDWEDWNPPIPADRTNAERQRRWREKQRRNGVTDFSPEPPLEEKTKQMKVMNERVTPLRNETVTPLRNAVTETPLTAITIREYFPNTDSVMIRQIYESAVRAHVDFGGVGELSDSQVAEAVRMSYWKNQDSAGPFRKGVATIIEGELQKLKARANGDIR